MVLACALLFSCATDNEVISSDEILEETIVAQPVVIVPEIEYIAPGLKDNQLIAAWAEKYQFAQNPSFYGIPLIVDNSAFGAIPDDILARKQAAENLADQNRFLDAWYAYGEDDNEYIIALKIMDLCDTFTDSVMHQIFVLSNLEPDEDLYEYRENPSQSGETLFWDPVSVAENYVTSHCNGVMPHILEMALGCYYHSAILEFGDDWIMPAEDAFELAAEYFKKAIVSGTYNDYALFHCADTFMAAGYIDDALDVIHCLELSEPEYNVNFYLEAQAFMCKGEYQKALPCLARCLLYATTPDDIIAGAELMADAFMYDSRDVSNALVIMNATKPYMGDAYYFRSVFMMLDILMFAKNRYPEAAYDELILSELSEAFAWENSDADYLYALTDYFYNYGYIDFGIQWIESILTEYKDNWNAFGNLNYELAQFYLQQSDYQAALDCFNLAEEYLTKAGIYNPEMSNIPYYQKQCQEQLLSQPKKNKA